MNKNCIFCTHLDSIALDKRLWFCKSNAKGLDKLTQNEIIEFPSEHSCGNFHQDPKISLVNQKILSNTKTKKNSTRYCIPEKHRDLNISDYISGPPLDLNDRLFYTCHRNGLIHLGAFHKKTKSDLLKMSGIGKKMLQEIELALELIAAELKFTLHIENSNTDKEKLMEVFKEVGIFVGENHDADEGSYIVLLPTTKITEDDDEYTEEWPHLRTFIAFDKNEKYTNHGIA